MATAELRELVSDLSERHIDVRRCTREELIAHRAALLRSGASTSERDNSQAAREKRQSDSKGIDYADIEGETAFIDPEVFPNVNWKRLDSTKSKLGGFSSVHMSSYKGKEVALKVFQTPRDPTDLANQWKTVRKEIGILQKVATGHPHTCGIVGVTWHPVNEQPVIVMWRMRCELQEYLAKNPSLPLKKRLQLIHELALGLLWLHDRPSPVLHLDLKLVNLMLDDRDSLVICDFGLSHVMDRGRQIRLAPGDTVKRGNVSHRAPELFSKDEITFGPAVDVYSFTICAWEILTGAEWNTNLVRNELIRKGLLQPGADIGKTFLSAVVFNHFRPPLNPKWPAHLQETLTEGWHHDPNQRPPMAKMVERFKPDGPIPIAFREHEKQYEQDRIRTFINLRLNSDPVAAAIALHAFKAAPKVDWKTFSSILWVHVKPRFMETCGIPTKTDMPSLQLALGATDSAPVTFEAFAKVVDAFRPLDGGFFQRIREVLEKPYVSLHLDSNKTREALHGCPEGSFSVRYSEKRGAAFTITKVLGDRKISQGRQTCVRFRIYREQEVAEDGSYVEYYYRLGHRDWAYLRFSTFTEIFEGEGAARMKLVRPSTWVSPVEKLFLPLPHDNGPMSASSAPVVESWAETKEPVENFYWYVPDDLYDGGDATESIRKLSDRRPMSPDHDEI